MNRNINKIFEKVARDNNTTVHNVIFEINCSIAEARSNPDPKIQAFWNTFPSKNKMPTPEELIIYLTNVVKNEECLFS